MTIETLQDTSWLELRQGTNPTRTIALEGELTIGRDLSAPEVDGHLAVDGDASISRLHAIFMRKPPGWCIQAPGSTNGLFVNGSRLADGAVHLLARNDEIIWIPGVCRSDALLPAPGTEALRVDAEYA